MNTTEIVNEASTNWNVIVTWIMTFFALLGAYYNATMRCKLSYAIWLLTNGYFVWHNYVISEYPQCVMFSFYLIIAIIGIKNTIKQPGWLTKGNLQ